MNIDTEGKKKQTTILGTSFTIFLYFIVGIYSIQQFIIMRENKKIDMITATSEYFFAETDDFNESQGLNIAMAFTGYDNEEEWILPREIGTLMFQIYEWGPDENGQFRSKKKNLTTHVCTEEELGLNDNIKNPNHG